MDPETTLRLAEEAAEAGDSMGVIAALCDLLEWVSRGGFIPRDMKARIDALPKHTIAEE